VSVMGADWRRASRAALPELAPGSSRIDIWPSRVTAESAVAEPRSVVQDGLGLSKEAVNNGVPAKRDVTNARALVRPKRSCRILL
jgi:hypothetical protein